MCDRLLFLLRSDETPDAEIAAHLRICGDCKSRGCKDLHALVDREADDSQLVNHITDCKGCPFAAAAFPSEHGAGKSHAATTSPMPIGASTSSSSAIPAGRLDLENLPVGLRFGTYTVGSRLSSGGMGCVYVARAIGGNVAIKVLKNAFAYGKDSLAQTVREELVEQAWQMGQVQSPHVVQVRDLLLADGSLPVRGAPVAIAQYDYAIHHGAIPNGHFPLVVMEYLDNGSLHERAHGGPPNSFDAIKQWGLQIATGLKAIHRANIAHLDIKPSNILRFANKADDLRLDSVKIADFGVHSITPVYAAPESEEMAREIDTTTPSEAADLYSFGATMFELCTGKHFAYQEKDQFRTVNRLYIADVERHLLCSKYGRLFAHIIVRCLRRDLHERYSIAGQLIRDLKGVRQPPKFVKALLSAMFVAAVILFVFGLIPSNAQAPSNGEIATVTPSDALSIREQLLEEAWKEYDLGQAARLASDSEMARTHYQAARTKTLEVIRDAKGDAMRTQRGLELAKWKKISGGRISDEKEKEFIFSLGTLNDTAAALWLYGRTSEFLEEHALSVVAYRECAKLDHALVYDVTLDSFWAPSQKAQDDLLNLTEVVPADELQTDGSVANLLLPTQVEPKTFSLGVSDSSRLSGPSRPLARFVGIFGIVSSLLAVCWMSRYRIQSWLFRFRSVDDRYWRIVESGGNKDDKSAVF